MRKVSPRRRRALPVGLPKPPTPSEQGARLMAQSKAASGGAALDSPAGFHEVGTFVRDGASGTYEVWGDLRALRSTASHTLGRNTFTNGFDGKTSWAVGPDGSVRKSDSSEALAEARLGTYLTIGGYFYPERFPARFEYVGRKQADGADYDVVRVTACGRSVLRPLARCGNASAPADHRHGRDDLLLGRRQALPDRRRCLDRVFAGAIRGRAPAHQRADLVRLRGGSPGEVLSALELNEVLPAHSRRQMKPQPPPSSPRASTSSFLPFFNGR